MYARRKVSSCSDLYNILHSWLVQPVVAPFLGGHGNYRRDPDRLRKELPLSEARGKVRGRGRTIVAEEPHHVRGAREANRVSPVRN